MSLLGWLLAFLIGVTLGMLGGGGSILTVPVFVYVLGYDPKLAIAMSLPVIGVTSLAGAVSHWRAGNVRLAGALSFGVVAMAGAFAGARASEFFTARSQLFLLGALMLAAAVLMLHSSFRESRVSGAASPEATRGPDSGPSAHGSRHSTLDSRLSALPIALVVGSLTGLVGIGGGFLIVPALVVFARVPVHQAVGTSLVVIAMNATAGFAGQRRIGEIPFGFVVVFSGVAIAGILAGTWLVRFVRQRTLQRAFAVLLLVVAALVLWQNRALL